MLHRHNYGNFQTVFNDVTGGYIRSGIIHDGKETDKDPFMAPFPELLDVGVMGSCAHGRSGLCMKSGVECYQGGANKSEPDMSFRDFEDLARQCRGKTYQFALGGRGDPDMHRNFEDILACARENRIVPNFTTSGMSMDRHKPRPTKDVKAKSREKETAVFATACVASGKAGTYGAGTPVPRIFTLLVIGKILWKHRTAHANIKKRISKTLKQSRHRHASRFRRQQGRTRKKGSGDAAEKTTKRTTGVLTNLWCRHYLCHIWFAIFLNASIYGASKRLTKEKLVRPGQHIWIGKNQYRTP